MEWNNESIVRQIQEGQGNRNELLEKLWVDNLGLIQKIIHKLTGLDRDRYPDRQDFEDLEQQAFIGIMESINHYDSTKGTMFFSFAENYIRKSVYRYYDRSIQSVRIPAYMRRRIRQFMGEKQRLKESKGIVTDEMVQIELGWSDNAFKETLKAIQKLELQRLDSYLNENDENRGTILDILVSNENTSEAAMMGTYGKELHDLLGLALQDLSEAERNVLLARHYQGHNTGHIARSMNCTRQYVHTLTKSAYKRIRKGKYAMELLTFLPESATHRAEKRIQDEFKDLNKQERDLLI